MLELLVASLCLGDYACSDAAKGYYASRPALRRFIVDTRHTVRDLVGETTMVVILPIASAAIKKQATVRLGRNTTLRVSEDDTTVSFAWTY